MSTIRPDSLEPAGAVNPGAAIIVDQGATVNKATPLQVVDAAIPLASQSEAEAGENNAKRMTPLRVKQAIDALGVSAAALASPDPGKGAEMVGLALPDAPAPAIIRSVQEWVNDRGQVEGGLLGIRPGSNYENSAAINDALAVCQQLGGKTLMLPAGEIYFEDTLGGLGGSSNPGVSIQGMGIGQTVLNCAADTPIRAIDLFGGWQYGFKMGGFTLQSLATTPGAIIAGSMGFHVERSQTPGVISDMLVKGFDTNIDVGVHAQFLHWQNISSREGNILVNAYGQNADMNVWDNCMFYAGVTKGVLISAPRNIFRDCWFGTSSTYSDPGYVDVTIGYQAIRPEDIGKSSSTGPGAPGHSGQHGALIRPRFERGTSGTHTGPYIAFRDIDPRPVANDLSPFEINNPVMPNAGPAYAIEVADQRRGLRIIAPEKSASTPTLIHDIPAADGSIQYVEVTQNFIPSLFMGQRAYMTKGSAAFYFGATSVVDALGTVTAGGDATLTHDAANGVLLAHKGSAATTEILRYARPTATGDARFFLKAAKRSIGTVTLAAYTPDPNFLFRLRNIPMDVLEDGVSILVPGTSGGPVTMSVQVPPNAAGDILFEELFYASASA